jgi:ApbE superfamily uncharacterized protein (UPF0280 family)
MTRVDPPQAAMLADGERLHLHHGPIDLILWSDPPARAAAYARAMDRFRTVLQDLVDELAVLRRPAPVTPSGPVARRMAAAVLPFAPVFITPMAAVAGSVADEILAAMTDGTCARKAWVNNGGDIAFHLAPGATMSALMPGGRVTIGASDPVRGIATSGWRGRSQSLGIADAVTVLAATGAAADAAATMIANAVDLPGHPSVSRRPATGVKADSDLGDRLVTTGVGPLVPADRVLALDRGLAAADDFRARGLIHAACLVLQGQVRLTTAALAFTLAEPADA